jgi:membrane protease YdiL (CAAX protease family)
MNLDLVFCLCLLAYPACAQLIPDPIWARQWVRTGTTEVPEEIKRRCRENYGNLLIIRFAALVPICFLLARAGTIPPRDLGFRQSQPIVGLVSGLGAAAFLIGWAQAMAKLSKLVNDSDEGPPHFLRQGTYKILFILLWGGFAEELWRAVSLTISQSVGLSAGISVIVTSLVFGLGHISVYKPVSRGLGRAAAPALAGCVLAVLFLIWHTLMIPLIAHVLVNCFAALLGRKRLTA